MERRLTIAHILRSPSRKFGPVEQRVFSLSEKLALRQHRVHMFGCSDFIVNCPDGVSLQADVMVGSQWDWRYLMALWRFLRQVKPELVHTHDEFSGRQFARFKRFFPAIRWVASGESLKVATIPADRLIVPGEGWKEQMTRRAGVSVIYPPGHAVEPLKPAIHRAVRESLQADTGRPLVVAFGPAISALSTAITGIDADIRLIGEGEMNPYNRVAWTGRRPVMPVLQVADLCILQSGEAGLMAEMTPVLLAGCPVVAVSCPTSRVWLPDYLLYEAGSPDNLRAVTAAALARRPNLRRGCLPVFMRAKEELTPEGAVQRVIDLYSELMEYRQ